VSRTGPVTHARSSARRGSVGLYGIDVRGRGGGRGSRTRLWLRRGRVTCRGSRWERARGPCRQARTQRGRARERERREDGGDGEDAGGVSEVREEKEERLGEE
jgi:hypothetical protein